MLYSIPAAAVGFRSSALIMRLTRSSMLEVLRQDYIRTARAKGASDATVNYVTRCATPCCRSSPIDRHRGGVPGRRADRHRNRVQHSGRRALPGRGDPLARLSDRAEPRDVHRGRRGGRSISWSTWPTLALDPRIKYERLIASGPSHRSSTAELDHAPAPMSPQSAGRGALVLRPALSARRGRRA